MIIYRLAQFGRFCISRLPARISYPIAAGIGDGLFYFWPRGRRNMIKSVANILNKNINDPGVKKISRHCMRNFIKYVVDLLRYPFPEEDFFKKQFQLSGRGYLDEALKEGNGVVLVSFHLGNLDLGIRLLSSLGYRINAIVNNLEWSGQLDRILQEPRSYNGVNLIKTRDASAHILEILRRNEVLALMIDCPNGNRGVKVKLGNKWVLLPAGAATLALRTGARLVPCGLVRTSNTTFQGIIGKAVEYQPTGKVAEDARELTQRVVRSLEEMTRQFVDQWYIFHPLIKDDLQDFVDVPGEDAAFTRSV
jgi:lauroyl/myristoyl acyltransferase